MAAFFIDVFKPAAMYELFRMCAIRIDVTARSSSLADAYDVGSLNSHANLSKQWSF